MTLHAFINFAANLAQFAIPAALFAWADGAWTLAETEAAPTTPTSARG